MSWLLLTEPQIDRFVGHRIRFLFGGIALMTLAIALPRGFGFGLLTGFMLFSLGVYTYSFQNWRFEPGVWMIAVLITVLLGPCWAYFEFLQWKTVYKHVVNQPNVPKAVFDWDVIRFTTDATISLAVFARSIKLSVSVGVENWQRTHQSGKA